MAKETPQAAVWSGEFGKSYTDRNILPPRELDALYLKRLGMTRQAMNQEFVGTLDRDARLLEVGSNVGNQLVALQAMGFRNLSGIELQEYAVEESKRHTKGINIIQGSAFDVPFKDGYFDLTFTSGVLIHISPTDAPAAVREICRCSKRWVWGMEYYAPSYQEVSYHGKDGLLWKTDFAQLFTQTCPELKVVKQKIYHEVDGPNEDVMYLLEKQTA
jgi:pseudaminic acid biosynthesis-associated methylase